LSVIPGKLAIASATRNPGKSKILDTRFREYDGAEVADYLANFNSRTLDLFKGSVEESEDFPTAAALDEPQKLSE